MLNVMKLRQWTALALVGLSLIAVDAGGMWVIMGGFSDDGEEATLVLSDGRTATRAESSGGLAEAAVMESETAGASRKEASPTGLATERPGLAEQNVGPNHSLPGLDSEATAFVKDEYAWENICFRHLAVQRSLMGRLSVNLCSVVNAGELYRVTEFGLSSRELEKGDPHHTLVAEDFAGLVNVESLDIHLPEGHRLAPGVFQHLTGLRNLTVSNLDLLDAGVLDGLGGLEKLDISVRDYDEQSEGPSILTGELLQGLDSLQELTIYNIAIVEAGALDGVPNLRYLSLDAEIVQPGTLANLENLRRMYVPRLGPTVEVANLEVACVFGGGVEPILLVDGEVVVVQTAERNGDDIICQVYVGQQQLEVRVDDLWPGYWQ